MGHVPNSFIDGVSVVDSPAMAGEGRDALVGNAQKAPLAGETARRANMSLGGCVVANDCGVTDNNRLLQTLAGNLGFDSIRLTHAKIPYVMLGDAEFSKSVMAAADKSVLGIFSTKKEDLLAEHGRLMEARSWVRRGLLDNERAFGRKFSASAKMILPIDVSRVLNKFVEGDPDLISDMPNVPVLLKEFDTRLRYLWQSDEDYQARRPVLLHYEYGSRIIRATVLLALNSAVMLKKNSRGERYGRYLPRILAEVWRILRMARAPAGQPIGLSASGSTSEQVTQYALDAKHRVGVTTTEVNPITRIKEILAATPSYKTKSQDRKPMEGPSMLIALKPEFNDADKAATLAASIESRVVKNFVTHVHVLFETYGQPKGDALEKRSYLAAMKFAGTLAGSGTDHQKKKGTVKYRNAPSEDNLNPWCVRLTLDHARMIVKSLSIDAMLRMLRNAVPSMFFIGVMNDDTAWIRGYLRNNSKNNNGFTLRKFQKSIYELLDLTLSGIPRIESAFVEQAVFTVEQDDGSLVKEKQYVIITAGTNLREVLNLAAVDYTRTISNCMMETNYITGLPGTEKHISSQIMSTLSMDNLYNVSLIAAQMTSGRTTEPTKIDFNGGIKTRDPREFLRHCLTQAPHNIANAALARHKTAVTGMNSLMLGKAPRLGTFYNDVGLDIKRANCTTADTLEEFDDML